MTTFTVNIDDKKSEKVIKAFLDALSINYSIDNSNVIKSDADRPLDKKEQKIYDSLKRSLEEIKRWEKGEVQLKNARELLNEL